MVSRGDDPPEPPAADAQTSRVPRGVFCFVRRHDRRHGRKRTATMPDDQFHVYDTTLRDGAQQEGLNLTVADKLVIARHLDRLGVGFIEGGWPGAIPKDTEFFRRAAAELDLEHAQLRSEERRVGK